MECKKGKTLSSTHSAFEGKSETFYGKVEYNE